MAIRYHFDLYPRANPKNGARLVRFTALQSAEYRAEANGSGSGRFSLRATESDAAFIDPVGLQYVRVVRENTVGPSEAVVGGFFLEEGDFEALNTDQTKLLTFSGAGVLSYLQRAQMWSQSYLTTPFIGSHPFDDLWRLYAAGTGNELGAILWRVLQETQEAARNQDPLPDLTIDFDYDLDSNGASWSRSSGDFTAQNGETVTSILKRLMELGLYVEMDPDTFELHAYEPGTHGRDRTGVAWGTSVIRFQSPTDGTLATGNIMSDAKRGVDAKIRRTHMLVGANDNYEAAADPSDIVWEGFYRMEAADDAAGDASLVAAGTEQLAAQSDAGDTARLRFIIGTAPTSGTYLPFESAGILPDDLATLHTGSGDWDWNEAALPVAAITVKLREGGDWDGWVDLGSTYTSIQERAFQDTLRQIIRQPGSHTHPPNPMLCEPPIECQALTSRDLTATSALNGDAENAAGAQWSGGGYTTARYFDGIRSYEIASSADGTLTYTFDPAQVFTAGTRYVLDLRARIGGSGIRADLHFGVAGGDEAERLTASYIEETAGADGANWAHYRICWTPTADRTGVRATYRNVQTPAAYIAADALSLFTTTNSEQAGTSNRAARCDHGHRAQDVAYNPVVSGLSATDVQGAIDEHIAEHAVALVTDHGNMGAAETFDASVGTDHEGTQDANLTVTLAGATDGEAAWLTLKLTQDGTGGRTLTLPASVIPAADIEAAWNTDAGAVNVLTLFSYDGGVTWYAFLAGTGSNVGALDDLSDVTITTPALYDRMRYDGTTWRNSDRIYRPLLASDGTIVTGSSGQAIMSEGPR